jgi:hypothetical protein
MQDQNQPGLLSLVSKFGCGLRSSIRAKPGSQFAKLNKPACRVIPEHEANYMAPGLNVSKSPRCFCAWMGMSGTLIMRPMNVVHGFSATGCS